MLGKVGDHAPHGGPIVLPVVDQRVRYVVAMVSGAVLTAVLVNLLKSSKPLQSQENPA
jgi:fructose-specific phosphotransferase system IIC component